MTAENSRINQEYQNIEQEDSRTRLIKELTEENHEKDVLITELRAQLKEKYASGNPDLNIPNDIRKITKVITHLTKHMKLTRDVGAKARLGTSISSLMKQKNVMVEQVIGLYEILDKHKKLGRKDHRYN